MVGSSPQLHRPGGTSWPYLRILLAAGSFSMLPVCSICAHVFKSMPMRSHFKRVVINAIVYAVTRSYHNSSCVVRAYCIKLLVTGPACHEQLQRALKTP